MPDIGFGEILVIVVLALLVFGPDRLPKVAADAARTLRQVRQMAATARKDLVDASGLEDDGEMAQTVRDIRDLDPRRAMQGVLTDDPVASSPNGGKSAAAGASGQRGGRRVGPRCLRWFFRWGKRKRCGQRHRQAGAGGRFGHAGQRRWRQ